MMCVRLEIAEAQQHTLGVRRARHLRGLVTVLVGLGLLAQGGRFVLMSAQANVQEQRRMMDQAVGAVGEELERLRVDMYSKESAQRLQAQFDGARGAIPRALKQIAAATPSELSLTEMRIDGDVLRLRGIAAHGAAIQAFLERLAQVLPARESALENVQRIEERGSWHDQFLVRIVFDGVTGAPTAAGDGATLRSDSSQEVVKAGKKQ
jgi:Tfp pilus assembly protein PilN